MFVKDMLTGLLNKTTFLSLLQEKIDQCHKKQCTLSLLFIEFDELARFNDVFTSDIDEQLLVQLAQTLRKVIKKDEILARADMYSFVILTEQSDDKTALEEKADSILGLLSEPFSIEKNMFYITASIGICTRRETQKNAAILLKTAENTVKHAQQEGINHIAFASTETTPSIKKELRLMKDLPGAIDSKEFYFLYQGQYSHRGEKFTGAEILMRWKHRELGEIPPSVFIPLAEKSGMIGPLTTILLIEASCMFEQLKEKDKDGFSLSVNISPHVLMEKSFLDTIKFLMESYGLRGKNLNFEIMEDTIAGNLNSFASLLQNIKSQGIGIEIDDYGTGHTSLNYLITLPIDMLKIDRSFVTGIDTNQKKFALLKAIIDMTHALDIGVIIEGVESEAEDEKIKTFKEVTTQGYFYCRPLPKEELFLLL